MYQAKTKAKVVPIRLDFILTNHGSLFTLKAITMPAEKWMDEYLPSTARKHNSGVVRLSLRHDMLLTCSQVSRAMGFRCADEQTLRSSVEAFSSRWRSPHGMIVTLTSS
jgi:hypothetical protein